MKIETAVPFDRLPICEDELRIIYEFGKAKGIRDRSGFLLFFRDVSRFPDQEKRYSQEVQQQNDLADFILAALAERDIKDACPWSPLTNKRWPDYAAISITTGCGVFIGTADQHVFANRIRNGGQGYCVGCGKPIEVNTP